MGFSREVTEFIGTHVTRVRINTSISTSHFAVCTDQILCYYHFSPSTADSFKNLELKLMDDDS